jgi:hypothetical protein
MKKYPHCDFAGTCRNKAYREVFPSMLAGKNKKKGWSYLCRKHFDQEQRRYKGKLPYSVVSTKDGEIAAVKIEKGVLRIPRTKGIPWEEVKQRFALS